MIKFNPLDVISIQDCLDGYARLLESIEPSDETDVILKEERLRIVHHLTKKCEVVLRAGAKYE